MDPKLALLQNAFFAEAKLDPGSLEDLARALTERRFPRGTAIFREGDPAPDMFFVVSGRVGIFKQTGDARVPLAEVGPGGYFGEIALVDGGDRSADADALEDVESLVLEAALFDELLERAPRLAVFFLRATSKRLRALGPRAAETNEAPQAAPDRISDGYPFPIAAVYRSLSVTVDPRPRLERFFDLLEVTVRYLGLVAVAQYLAGTRHDRRLDDLVERGVGTLGQWLGAVDSLASLYAEPGTEDELFIAEMRDSERAPSPVRKALGDLYAVVRFRNAQRHGAGGAMSDAAIAAALAEQEPRLRAALGAMRFLAEHRLIFWERMSFSRGSFAYRYQACVGSHSEFSSASMTLEEPLETGHAYLLHPSGEHVLPLHPLVLIDSCTVCAHREAFFIYRPLPTTAEYVEFRRGHHLATTSPVEAFDRIRGPVVERRRALTASRQGLALASSAELAAALGSPEAATRIEAARILGARCERSATPAFVRALGTALASSDGAMAVLACQTLGKLADRRALEVLLRAATEPPERPFVPSAIDALGKLAHKDAVPALSAALVWPALRGKAVRALVRLGSPGLAGGVIESLDPAAGSGVIRDASGRGVAFLLSELKGKKPPGQGEHVTFFAYDGPDGPVAAGVERNAAPPAQAFGDAAEARGVVRWFDRTRARGFIRDDETGKDVLVQGGDGSLRARQRVRYQRIETNKGLRATNVVDDTP